MSDTWTNNQPKKLQLIDRTDLPTLVAILIVVSFVALIFTVLFIKLPTDQTALTVITTLVGVLCAKFGTIVDFLFGSSTGSKTKDAAIIEGTTK